MKKSQSIVDVAIIVRQFLQNEARTLEISKGKMLKDPVEPYIMSDMMKAG